MTVRTMPEIQQTLPGRTTPYRLFTVEHCDWEDFAPAGLARPPVVTLAPWGTSYTQEMDENWERTGMVEMHVYDVRSVPGETVKHPLYGTTYPTQEQATRAAWEAGVLAFMVYVTPTYA
jgi:hypothetical protein